MLEAVTIIVGLSFALNIGASGTAAAMSAAYGSGAVPQRWLALLLVSGAFVLGAVLAGSEVTRTLGNGLVDASELTVGMVLVVLLAATLPLVIANLLTIPVSTSAVTVGAIVGAGLAIRRMDGGLLCIIVIAWVALPVLSFLLTAAVTRLIGVRMEARLFTRPEAALIRALAVVLAVSGVFAGFAFGANNVANAIGPLVGAGLLAPTSGLWIGGLVIGAGALLLGRGVLETSAKLVTSLSLVTGSIVNGVTGVLVLAAALLGIPVPIVQAISAGIMGVGYARRGRRALRARVVRDMVTVWVASPAASLGGAYLLAHWVGGTNPLLRPESYPIIAGSMGTIGITLLLVNRDRIARARPVLTRLRAGLRALNGVGGP